MKTKASLHPFLSGNMVFPRQSTDKTNFWTKLKRKEDNSFFFCKFHCYLELFFFNGADNLWLDCYTEKWRLVFANQ